MMIVEHEICIFLGCFRFECFLWNGQPFLGICVDIEGIEHERREFWQFLVVGEVHKVHKPQGSSIKYLYAVKSTYRWHKFM